MKTLKTTEPRKYGSFQVIPDRRGNRVYFSFTRRGGMACYDLECGKFIPVQGEVGARVKSWIIENYIQDGEMA